MEQTIRFEIPIEPRAQKRDRIGTIAGHGHSYKHPEQSKYEAKVAALISQHRPDKPIEGAIKLHIACYLPIPKSKPKKWKQAALDGEIKPTGKPDCTNLAKNIEDIMNGIFYRDDSQMINLEVDKLYSDNPRWVILLWYGENVLTTNSGLEERNF
jgi:Holliday junction resolvase RusA-like endonuclease